MKKKRVDVEIIRVVAIILVIFNHTGEITAFTDVCGTRVKQVIYLIPALLCKTAVPLFFMVSGCLLLGKDISLNDVLKRIVKKSVELILITVLYIIYKYVRYGEIHNVAECFIYLWTGQKLSVHLWFMYVYIAFLFLTPVLNLIAKSIDGKTIWYLFWIVLAFKFVEFLQYIIMNDSVMLSESLYPRWLYIDIFIYPIFGYYFGNKEKPQGRYKLTILLVGLAGLIIEIIETMLMGFRNNGEFSNTWVQKYYNHFVLFMAIAVFVFITEKSDVEKEDELKIIITLGDLSYGVYIIHIIIKDMRFMKSFMDSIIRFGIDYMIANIIYVLTIYVISGCIVYFFKQVILFTKDNSLSRKKRLHS